jgi:PAS domain-containing protein
LSLDELICDEIADCGSSLEPQIGLMHARRRNRKSATAEDRAAPWAGFGFAEITAKVGGLIRQSFPLHVVLTTLCQHFDQTVHGCLSSVLLLDRTGTRVRNAPGYIRNLKDGRVNWIETSVEAATINAKRSLIAPHPVSDTLREEVRSAAPPGYKLHEVSPILSLTGEPLGLFAVYQRKSSPDHSSFNSAYIAQFTNLLSTVIERMRSDQALNRSAELLERAQQLSATCCFSWRVKTSEISWSKELGQLFDLGAAVEPVTLEMLGARIHSEDLPSFHEMLQRARSGVSEIEFEYRIRHSDNSVKYLRVIATGTCDQEGQLEYIGAFQVAHRRHAEEALAGLRAELARAARVASLGVLTAAVAHEVNQPPGGHRYNRWHLSANARRRSSRHRGSSGNREPHDSRCGAGLRGGQAVARTFPQESHHVRICEPKRGGAGGRCTVAD